MDDDQIVGDHGEFRGNLISPLLEDLSVRWWDSLKNAPTLEQALKFCACFPMFRLEVDEESDALQLLLQTEGGTWYADQYTGWRLGKSTSGVVLSRKSQIENDFIQLELQREATSEPIQTTEVPSFDVVDNALKSGIMSRIIPALAAEAHAWYVANARGLSPQQNQQLAGTDFIEALSCASLLVSLDGVVTDIIVSTNESVWRRDHRQWIQSSETPMPPNLAESRRPIEMSRLVEITAWWDENQRRQPHFDKIPISYTRPHEPLGLAVDHSSPELTNQVDIFDGHFTWTHTGSIWTIEADEGSFADSSPDEPWAEEQLPDWFYR
ncbi:hypothetical protein [Arthrobacter wenxiniae]|uniref:Uncharacterized protein n=1 Tax=Arthrobacter wenxiniae TaxID=2713570 RepID=A0A7Y7IIP5_9MICC|nr:hypothetical protein [Arthrobacter wenxiniae]NVM96182.1 hypothetical protein [Arthrobacter wenxiniae]